MSVTRLSPENPSAQYIYSITKLMAETIIIPMRAKIGRVLMIPRDTLGNVELGALLPALEVEFSSVVSLLGTG